MKTFDLTIAGLKRSLPIVRLSENLAIASFVLLGDTELAVLGAEALADKINTEFDYFLTAEAKGIPLVQCIAQEFNHPKFYVARKSVKAYMDNPLITEVLSITTQASQQLVLDGKDAAELKGKKVILIDDVISTGDSLAALKQLAEEAGAIVVDQLALLAEGDAAKRTDIQFLEELPLFD
ncbi:MULTISPECIES: phosphoribosyltransferase family protein [Aerococcaceae]|uniref:Adenine phosphoribosyltransferase n=2 Tax=Aerococcaceae TaxID=186827 RepID=A0A6I2GAG7_9LACT|nr:MULTISPECIES: phosphoribosyltransferase family protein [Aerococcaceae]MRI80528.1 adenine phosphoribosyltransferase [Fundicoccus ignavus]MRI84760.1 adenine phosphoribosyltransferase [Fundicoccus ignavus]MRJ48114.1 adenine phosphoribosyltransferase [Fundicoccus ignavus]TLQ41482.1 adenine phosphoribosyltransferase [Ruoffia tabacinasalis]HJG48664.1 adenine phosphoribosyltransferase [Ruoffia tabacinasalis]